MPIRGPTYLHGLLLYQRSAVLKSLNHLSATLCSHATRTKLCLFLSFKLLSLCHGLPSCRKTNFICGLWHAPDDKPTPRCKLGMCAIRKQARHSFSFFLFTSHFQCLTQLDLVFFSSIQSSWSRSQQKTQASGVEAWMLR